MAWPHLSRESQAEILLLLATGMGLESLGLEAGQSELALGVLLLCRRGSRWGLTRADLST